MSDNEIAIGLDIGTGGARAIALDMTGRLVAEGRSALPAGASTMSGPCVEQDPEAWSTAARNASRKLTIALPGDAKIVGISVDATSGTFVLADDDCQPLTRGIMYNDLRAAEETPAVAAALGDVLAPYGITIAPAFALPKIVHLARQDPERFARCHRILHQTDWIVGMLTGNYDVTDISTALKTGADPGTLSWPDALEDLGIPRTVLPALVAPGTPIGEVTASASKATGLPAGTPVIAGCTDGTAGFLASGARHTGDLNVTLGTTMVLYFSWRRRMRAVLIPPRATWLSSTMTSASFSRSCMTASAPCRTSTASKPFCASWLAIRPPIFSLRSMTSTRAAMPG